MVKKVRALMLLLVVSDLALALSGSCIAEVVSSINLPTTDADDGDFDLASDSDDDTERPSSVLHYDDEDARRAAAVESASVTLLEGVCGAFLIYRFDAVSGWAIMVGQHIKEIGVHLGADRAYTLRYSGEVYNVSSTLSPAVKFIVEGQAYRGIALWHEGPNRDLLVELELFDGSTRPLAGEVVAALLRGEGCSAEVVLALKAVIFAGYHLGR